MSCRGRPSRPAARTSRARRRLQPRFPTDQSSIGGEAPAWRADVRAGDRPDKRLLGKPRRVRTDRLLIEIVDGDEAVAQPDCPRLCTWEVRVPVVVRGPRKQQRLCRSRNLVERRAEMEVPELDKRGIRAEEHGGAALISDRRERLGGDPVTACSWKLLRVELYRPAGAVEQPTPAGRRGKWDSEVQSLRKLIRLELKLDVDANDGVKIGRAHV